MGGHSHSNLDSDLSKTQRGIDLPIYQKTTTGAAVWCVRSSAKTTGYGLGMKSLTHALVTVEVE